MTGSNPQPQAAKIRIQVEIRLSGKSELRAIMKALMPDNVNFPKGLSMEIISRDNTLVLELLSKIGINTLLNTIDEVLEHISIARKVIRDA
ncbi:MAG TPA: KEOPS complex subunit Pcc1 [Nitrososphaeraceae archaeon]|nr:KEOPS complex subunit Pcc1 [Nitrososphaeraceae archaeon]